MASCVGLETSLRTWILERLMLSFFIAQCFAALLGIWSVVLTGPEPFHRSSFCAVQMKVSDFTQSLYKGRWGPARSLSHPPCSSTLPSVRISLPHRASYSSSNVPTRPFTLLGRPSPRWHLYRLQIFVQGWLSQLDWTWLLFKRANHLTLYSWPLTDAEVRGANPLPVVKNPCMTFDSPKTSLQSLGIHGGLFQDPHRYPNPRCSSPLHKTR